MNEQLQFDDSHSLISLKQAWIKALSLLESEIAKPSFESFIRTAQPISIEKKTVCIGAANELAKIFLDKYNEHIKIALESILGYSISIEFIVMAPQPSKSKSKDSVVKQQPPAVNRVCSFSLPLNDKYVFSNFVVGAFNQVAHNASLKIAENPGTVFNPFFLYGGPGLGKTHLLQAIAHQIIDTHQDMKVVYVSGEVFTSHYVNAVREHRSEDFRRRYRGIDVLLVDDIQFLAGKEKTNEEFFHTFNALHQINKQIILCSDRSPKDLYRVEERMKSRFESGLVVDIPSPDMDTRIAILQAKSAAENYNIPDSVIECIAKMIPTNIRALEGALVTLVAYSSLMNLPLTIDLACDVLNRHLTEKKYTELTPDIIIRVTAAAFNVDTADIVGSKRNKELVIPRHAAIYISRELTQCSLPMIGKAFGGRDHSTILHACNRIKDIIESNSPEKEKIESIMDDLRNGRY